MVLVELQKQLGIKALINKQCRDYMETYFDLDTITLPAISDEYCNYKEVLAKLEPFEEHFDDLVNNEYWLKGKMLEFYPLREKGDKNFQMTRHRFERCVFNNRLTVG